ncbi:restriction endonuclease subunit S [Bacillus altitudinis]|uniref:restriction endonuclease subunit S n=1 Tax=Bacillus altitudinis TaxID=293387 RepID=UPI0002D744FC|nr:restriction endonuclease subunit S [Bacillus altitudinis]QKL22509.1 restriction endonuclease subunit S [Bacillus altitudinis]QKL26242.1 restriction endonuclease subunit S [Bacillus altitudinis]QXY96625.1 restriction endonuclease subunit S [Bacillus altitudinis]WOQ71216.1 restriction endonuclease subunit S [Bacillus stratosphericus]
MSKKKKTIEELLEESLVPKEEQPYEVPANWVWTKLGKIANYYNGKAFKSIEWSDKGRPIIRIQDLTGTNKGEPNYFEGQVAEKYEISEGDLLVSWSATLGAYIWSGPDAVLNQHIFKVESFIDKKYHYYAMQSIIDSLYSQTHGSGMVHITKKLFDETPFPLPSLIEQKRITEKVEQLLIKIEEAKQLIEEAKKTFELRRAAILDKAFRGDLTRKWREENQCDKLEPIEQSSNLGPFKLPHGWEWKKLGEIGELQRGKSKHRPRNDPKLFGGDYPFIQTGDIARSSDYVENFSQTLSEFGYNQSKLFPIGTVCITIAANIADTAVLKFPCCFPDSVVGFVPFKEIVSSEFVHYYISTIKNDLEHYAPATAQKNINLKILNEVLVPVPSLREHEVIMDKIKNLLDKEYEASQYLFLENSIDLLKQSILSKAFRGELGTNDPSEDNAIELLKEVLQEQVK